MLLDHSTLRHPAAPEQKVVPCLVQPGAVSFPFSVVQPSPAQTFFEASWLSPSLPQGSVPTSPTSQSEPQNHPITTQSPGDGAEARGRRKAGGLWGGMAQPVPACAPDTMLRVLGKSLTSTSDTTRWKEMPCLTEHAKSTCKWGEHKGI